MRPDDGSPRILVTARRAPANASPATLERYARSTAYYVGAVRAAGGAPLVVRAGDLEALRKAGTEERERVLATLPPDDRAVIEAALR